MEGSGNHRGKSDGGSSPSAGINAAKDKCVKLHGVLEMEKRIDDLWSVCEFEIQAWEPTLLGEGLPYKHRMFERSKQGMWETKKQDQIMDRIRMSEVEDPFRNTQAVGASGMNEVKATPSGVLNDKPL